MGYIWFYLLANLKECESSWNLTFLDNITDEVIHSWKLEEESKIKWKSVVEQGTYLLHLHLFVVKGRTWLTDLLYNVKVLSLEVGWEFKYYTKIKELNNEKTLLLLSSSVSDTARHRIKLNRYVNI